MRWLPRVAGIAAVWVVFAACRTDGAHDRVCAEVPGAAKSGDPTAVTLAFADALEARRLDDAYALLAPEGRGTIEAFRSRYADAGARARRVEELRASAPGLRAVGDAVTVVDSGGWKIVDASPAEARETLQQFLTAAERGDFTAAYRLLSGAWRAQYTPERFARDFEAEPLAKERLARARVAATRPGQPQGDSVLFPIGDGKAVKLVREDGAFRVAALE